MTKKTILIVDDTLENLYLLRVILEERGYVVIEANNGEEGLKKLNENNNVDLIISDILMPVMDGYMFCQACKKDLLFKHIPFVFYTSTYTEKLDEDFALKLGAAQFLRKPIDHDELILTVNNIFGELYKPVEKPKSSALKNEDVFKLYNERLIHKLEQKSVDLGNEIDERKKSEALLLESKNYLDNIINNIGDPIFVKDDQSRLLIVNEAFCKIFSLSKSEIIGLTLAENVTQEEREIFLKIDKEVIASGIENINEESLTIGNHEKRIISTKKTRYIDHNGNRFLIGIIRDITDRKQAEIKIKESEQSLLLAQSLAKIGSFNYDLDTHIIQGSKAYKEIIGVDLDSEMTFDIWRTITHPEDTPNNQKVFQKSIDTGETFDLEYRIITKNNKELKWIHGIGEVIYENGVASKFFGTIQDVSERVKAQQLLESRANNSIKRKNTVIELANLVGQNFDQCLNQITSLSAKTLNVERVSVWKLNGNKSENHCQNLYNLKSDSFSKGQFLKREDHPKYFKQLEEKSIVSVNDAQTNILTKSMAKDYLVPANITAKISIAINGLDGLYGIICFEHVGNARVWDYDEEEFAISVANIVSLMIENSERKFAEAKIARTNKQLLEANNELNILRNQLELENVYLRNELDLVFNYEEMVYGSSEFSNVLTEVEKVAPTTATVLLLGESGTGKELVARAIHKTSLRNKKPLIKVNCSAIPRELIESELFGHKKGSFTGAFNDKVGKFALADGGTLFLDEIGELPLDMQPKILRFLQEGEIEVVGATGIKKLDVRVIAATNRNLKAEIEKKQFREDLYFRLHVFPIVIPPLRDRKDDIPLLVEHFIDKFNKAYAKSIKYIPDDSMNQLKEYEWPGNIRELENLIERASILSTSETLLIPGFESKNQISKSHINDTNLTLDQAQRNHIIEILKQSKWKVSGPNGAATLLGLKPSTLRDKINKLGIVKP
jgi:PAS domain S-box-containing protein